MFAEKPRLLNMPDRRGLPRGLIAAWGEVDLVPLVDTDAISALAAGESPRIGLLIDFLGDLHKSAKLDLPLYRISGGPGYVWSTSFDQKGVGHLRFFAVDVSALDAPRGSQEKVATPKQADEPPSAEQEEGDSSGSGFAISKDDVVVAEYRGTGIQSTRPFTVDGPWEVQWSSDSSYLSIYLKNAEEEAGFPNIIANQQGSGPGSSYQPKGGTYYFETNAMGKWHMKVVALKSPSVAAAKPETPPAPVQVTPEASQNSELLLGEAASGDTITAGEIAAGISSDKTELEQETWWDERMGNKTHKISGDVTDVEKGTFSGYWVDLDIGRNMRVRCGFDRGVEDSVKSLRKGSRMTCNGKVSNTWTSIFGVMFDMESSADRRAAAPG
jgi:hypothetical protein